MPGKAFVAQRKRQEGGGIQEDTDIPALLCKAAPVQPHAEHKMTSHFLRAITVFNELELLPLTFEKVLNAHCVISELPFNLLCQ